MSLSEPVTLFWLHACEWALLASGLCLVIGLIGEYKLSFWHPRLEVFEMLVLIGCGAELFCDAGIFLFSKHLESIERSQVASLSVQAAGAASKAAKALTDSGTAIGNAGTALDKANKATTSAGNAQQLARGASTEADAVGTQAEELSKQLNDAQKQLSNAEAELTKEQQERAKIEKDLAPRLLPIITGPSGNTVAMSPFAGIRVLMEYVPDAEARRAAEEIRTFVRFSGWIATNEDLSANPQLFSGPFDGVLIEVYNPWMRKDVKEHPPTADQILSAERSGEAADALTDVMHSFGWKARVIPGPVISPPVGENEIRIMIGMKPNQFDPFASN